MLYWVCVSSLSYCGTHYALSCVGCPLVENIQSPERHEGPAAAHHRNALDDTMAAYRNVLLYSWSRRLYLVRMFRLL